MNISFKIYILLNVKIKRKVIIKKVPIVKWNEWEIVYDILIIFKYKYLSNGIYLKNNLILFLYKNHNIGKQIYINQIYF